MNEWMNEWINEWVYLNVLSLNIQSINAKFDEFKIALDQLNNKRSINIICIQETWVDSTTDTCVFKLPNYQKRGDDELYTNH